MIIKRTKKKKTSAPQKTQPAPRPTSKPNPVVTGKPVVGTSVPNANEIEESFIKERQERRRGDRRRGYRRVDDRNIISRAHEEANSIRENAAKEGFEYGLNQAHQEIMQVQTAMGEFLRAKELAYADVSNDIIDIALKVAEKIIKIEAACDESIILRIIDDVVRQIGSNASSITIKTSPDSVDIVKENVPKIFTGGNSNARIDVVADNTIDAGSCIIITNNGIIDASFQTQLAVLKKALDAGL